MGEDIALSGIGSINAEMLKIAIAKIVWHYPGTYSWELFWMCEFETLVIRSRKAHGGKVSKLGDYAFYFPVSGKETILRAG